MAACTSLPSERADLPSPQPATLTQAPAGALSAEAELALKAAERSVLEARLQRALWIAAVEELDKARAAAKALNSEATLKHAREANLLCALSLQQKQAPPVSW
jgi:hypothetical protein